MAAYLEESDVRHDRSDNSDNLGIIVEQIPPVLLECDANHTASSASIPPHPETMTYLLQAEKKMLMIKLVRLAHFASHPRPAPRRLPVLTAEAIPSEAGTWKNVLVVERRQD
jgi:hypothetical protein